MGVVLFVAATAPGVAWAQAPPPEVSYRFTYGRAGDPTVAIEMAWGSPLAEPRSLVMPRAIPMGYGEQRYDAFVIDVRAFAADGRSVAAEREEGPRWKLDAGITRVSYRVDLQRMEREVRAASDASRVRDGYLGVLGYSVFAYVDGFEPRPARLRVEGPAAWPVFATLAPSRRAPPTSTSSPTARS